MMTANTVTETFNNIEHELEESIALQQAMREHQEIKLALKEKRMRTYQVLWLGTSIFCVALIGIIASLLLRG